MLCDAMARARDGIRLLSLRRARHDDEVAAAAYESAATPPRHASDDESREGDERQRCYARGCQRMSDEMPT